MQKKWSHKIHRMLTLWLSQISLNRKLHQEKSVSLSNRNELLAMIIITITGMASLGSFININDFSAKTKMGISLAMGITSLIACVLTSINNKMKLEENSILHRNISNEYSDLSNYIQMAILMPDKPPINELVKTITERIEIINRYGPPLFAGQQSIADLPNFILVKDAKVDLHESDIKLFLSPSDSSSDNVEINNVHLSSPETSIEIE